MDDLITWLRAIWDARERELDADERVAREAEGGWITLGPDPERTNSVGRHAARWDPARVLREVAAERADIEAKRRILDEHEQLDNGACDRCGTMAGTEHQVWPCTTVRLLALPYAGRDGWREEWTQTEPG